MFALRVDYLLGRAFAASHLDRDVAEWPPHPSRLYSALVAATYEADLGPPALRALRWLEAQAPPSLVFADESDVSRRTVVTSFVPVNDEIAPDGSRSRQPRAFPSIGLPDGAEVGWFVWDSAEPDAETRDQLGRIAAEVSRLGHSSSLVRVSPDDAPPEATWVPDPRGDVVLRVPRRGRLEALDAAFAANRRPPDGSVAAYRRATERHQADAPSPYSELRVLRVVPTDGPRMLPLIRDVAAFADAVRCAWLSVLDRDAPASVHGHDGPHVAIAPLPAVGHPRSDGRVHGIGVAVPAILDPAERQRLGSALARLSGLEVYVRSGVTWRLEPLDPSEELPKALQTTLWMRASKHWATVTPIVLDRFPRRSLVEDAVVAASLVLSGYPAPTRVRVSRFTCVPGVPPSFTFARRRGGPPRPVLHATVEFDAPVRGPVLAGQLRHFGLGLFRPVPADQASSWLDDEEAP